MPQYAATSTLLALESPENGKIRRSGFFNEFEWWA